VHQTVDVCNVWKPTSAREEGAIGGSDSEGEDVDVSKVWSVG